MAKRIRAAAKQHGVIAFSAPAKIIAADIEGVTKGPPRFEVVAYTGGLMDIAGYDLPLVVDISGVSFSNSLVANLDHDAKKRVGHVTEKTTTDNEIKLAGLASAATAARDEVVNSAVSGFVWQASIEADPTKLIELAADKTAEVNGQTVTGPAYIARKSKLFGFAFVSHGADDNTSVSIAAGAASLKGKTMKAECKAWAESIGVDVANASEEQLERIEANYEGLNPPKKKEKAADLGTGIQARKAEVERVESITEIALSSCDKRPYDIEAIKGLAESAIDLKWTVEKFRLELLEASLPPAHAPFRTKRDDRMSNKVIEAAICMAGRLDGVEGKESPFDEPTLEAAHKHFPRGVGLKQLFLMCAEANGYHGSYANDITLDVQRAAFGQVGHNRIQAQGFSTLSIATILSDSANKYLRESWNHIDMTPLRIANVRSVRDFREITVVSLTGGLIFEKVGPAGEIKHGTLGETTYGGKAETHAKMLAITRQDMINDDLGVLTDIPRRLGRGAALALNHIFWTEFLSPTTANFWHANNNNVNTGVADMTAGGLAATEAIFLAQTDPDGLPLGTEPRILLVPPALKGPANTLMSSDRMLGSSGPDGNIWRGRFRVESSSYMANSAYTGYSAAAWYMLADPNDIPVIEIVALNGRVEPVIESADTDFNTLGVQFRGYSDIGVRVQEPRGGVRADGGAS